MIGCNVPILALVGLRSAGHRLATPALALFRTNAQLIQFYNTSAYFSSTSSQQQQSKQKRELSILFYGSDDFSLASLTLLSSKLIGHKDNNNNNNSYNDHPPKTVLKKLEVVTTSSINPVSAFCRQANIVCHQYDNYRVPENVFDLGVVSSFGRLIPKSMIDACPYGNCCLHLFLQFGLIWFMFTFQEC